MKIPYAAGWFTLLTFLSACSATQSVDNPDATSHDSGTPVTLTAVKSYSWGNEEVVATGDITIAFNNTGISARDKNDGVHVVWAESQKTVRYGYLAKGTTTWQLHDVPRTAAGAVSKPTLSVNGTTAIVVWNETGPSGIVAGNATTDFGATWAGALQISDGGGASASLIANDSATPFAASVAWVDSTSKRLKVRAIAGSTWGASSLTAVQTLDANATKPSGDPQIFGKAPSLWITWDNGEEGAGHDVHIAQSTDGLTFANEHLIGVTQPSRDLNSGNDASGCAVGSSVYLGYQDGNGIYVARSTDGGKTFEPKGKIGDGLFAHLECISERAIVAGWEFFTGANLKNNDVKTVGSAYTLDGWDTVTGPHAIPGSDTQMGRIMGTASHSDNFLDYWWVETPGASAKLGHRAAVIVRE